MEFRTWMRTGVLGLVVAGAAMAGGCSASKGNLTVHANEGEAVMAQSFNQAYISASHDGEYDVLMIQDPVVDQSKAKAKGGSWPMRWFRRSGNDGTPLQPTEAAQLRQVVHVHVFWQSDNTQAAKDGVVTNAAIDWYVIAHESSDRAEVLRYQGAGHVTLKPGRNDTTAVRINNGSMKQAEVRGGLQDPFGPSTLVGTVTAQRNSQFVRETLADLKAQTTNLTNTAVSQAR